MINIINDAMREVEFASAKGQSCFAIHIYAIKYLKKIFSTQLPPPLLKLNANYVHNLHFTFKK